MNLSLNILVQKRIREYEREHNLTNIFLIKTAEACSTPKEISYGTMLNYFQELSKDEKIFLIGGYNWWFNSGCLGSLKKSMRDKKLPYKVISKFTFS